ncbi:MULTISPECIES: hypothetical protein [Streptomyces]|uniref:Uncharacterized protein n=1 Tax=Streptomyces bangladeshensis TaxID=295352 RepID=A0ABN3BV47_9ACTN|nr:MULTISPECIES: hypothetical protein [unclassified Streptomyces]OYP16047.1 hypothetical protein CFC35_17290 [Streptomyces sp. FBKL.4005]BCM68680.1 hypothetical protein EASAB2608_04014 [Streptomyces sp. EAS-AB2608]
MTTTTPPPPPADPTAAGPLTPTDHRAFAFLGQVNSSLRQCLCTLARHGVALRRDDPERARLLLDTVRPWPLYKGGQFLFDLMEWEDLMVDGDPPPVMPAERIVSACALPVQLLAAATAEAPGAAKLVPGPRTAAAFDLPLRLLTTTARSTFLGAAQDLTDLLGPRAAPDDDAGYATDPEPVTDDTVTELPPLEAGFYLYEDIALGALAVLGPLLADHAPTDTAPPA